MIRRTQSTKAALLTTGEELHSKLGNVPTSRIRTVPPPGTAKVDDVIHIQDTEGRTFELLDQTLVEKTMGFAESVIMSWLIHWLSTYLDTAKSGIVTGSDGIIQLFPGGVRAPDVAFYSWGRLPGGKLPLEPCPAVYPDLAIEILSRSNTKAEMARKRREYFQAGVRLVWMVDIRDRSIAVYTSPTEVTNASEGELIDVGDVLPGLTLSVDNLFAALDQSDLPRE